jgi:hypothetical protein
VEVIVALALLAAVLALALTHALRGQREHAADQPGEEPAVTLSVLPGRRAVVTLDAKGDRSSGTAHLVDHAARHAFTLDGIDVVEVRRADGELLERRLRPTFGWPTKPTPAAPPAEGRPRLALREPDR